MRRTAAIALLLIFTVACGADEPQNKPLSVPGEKLYTVRGKVLARDHSDNTLRVDHEPIPNFMEAMVMDYSVRGAEVRNLPADGARIEAKLHVTDDGYWITDVRQIP